MSKETVSEERLDRIRAAMAMAVYSGDRPQLTAQDCEDVVALIDSLRAPSLPSQMGGQQFCRYPDCDCSSGAMERCSLPVYSDDERVKKIRDEDGRPRIVAICDELLRLRASAAEGERPCTCHPDDNPPVPCARKYALSDCIRESQRLRASPSPGWQPIETAPKDGTDILVTYKNCDSWFIHKAFWMDGDYDEIDGEGGWWSYLLTEVSRTRLDECCEPTHWMPDLPLPSAPAAGGAE